MNIIRPALILFFILLQNFIEQNFCSLTLKRVYCKSHDEDFITFKVCNNDGGIYKVHAKILQIPVTNCQLQIEFSSVIASYLKFNTSWNACEFMKNPKRFRALSAFYDIIGRYSNINHSCPYDHDIIVNMSSNFVQFYLPVMSSSYKFRTIWFVDKKMRATIGGMVDYVNPLKLKNKTVQGN